jgi:SAM-dependent methyltransferase
MSKWSKIYRKDLDDYDSAAEYIRHKISYKRELLSVVEKYSNSKKLLEAGCGSGASSIYLAQKGYEVLGVDVDPDMIKLANELKDNVEIADNVNFQIEDIENMDGIKDDIGVIFSNGVMEHFSDSRIRSIIRLHISLSDYVIISVPSDYFAENQIIYGNERFLSLAKWRKIIDSSKASVVEEFDFNPDSDFKSNKSQFIGFVIA